MKVKASLGTEYGVLTFSLEVPQLHDYWGASGWGECKGVKGIKGQKQRQWKKKHKMEEGKRKKEENKRRNQEEGPRDQKIKMGGNEHFLHKNIHINRIAQMEDPWLSPKWPMGCSFFLHFLSFLWGYATEIPVTQLSKSLYQASFKIPRDKSFLSFILFHRPQIN